PWASARGYAELANAATGVSERCNGDRPLESGRHVLSFDWPRWTFTDYLAGALGAFAALLGLHHRAVTGRAPSVATSLVRATSLEQVIYLVGYAGPSVAGPRGDVPGWSERQRLYHASDGWLFVAAADNQTAALCAMLGVADLSEIAAVVRGRCMAELLEMLRAHDIGAHQVMSAPDLLLPGGAGEQAGLSLVDLTQTFGEVRMLGPVARLSRTPLAAGLFAEPFGAETPEIKAEGWRQRSAAIA
ncbi:MAG: hypothetical protein EOO78_05795, partial [Oxalobacteraceae bacterium]